MPGVGDEITLPTAGIGATLEDTIHVMGGNYTNHFHCTAEILPKLQIEPLSRYAFDGTILFPPMITAPLQDMAARMTLADRSVHSLGGRHAVHVKSLLFVPDLVGGGFAPNPRLAAFFDELKRFLGVVEQPRRRIYVARKDSQNRVLVNEDEVIAIVQRSGFEVVSLSGLDLVAQVRLFASASHIIAPHGAGLTNLVFSNSGGVAICELHMNTYLNYARCVGRWSGGV